METLGGVTSGDRPIDGWTPLSQAYAGPDTFKPDGPTQDEDPLLLYFTSGTTAKPKLVRHSQRSYPVGGLSTMYWLGLQRGDVHWTISSPGWAKHAWSCFFTPWIAEATVFIRNDARFNARTVLETLVEGFIANDCDMHEQQRMAIITGPNMGGKSTYMRQIALIVLMAHCGFFVPARSCALGVFDRIFTRIGASDDLAGGRSTFMVEMTEAAAILHHASEKSLVLMDEIGRGTSTYDGLALAQAIAEQLAQGNRSLCLFATHYFELTALSQHLAAVINLHLSAAEGRTGIRFLHQVREGPASRSYGIQVARLAGLPSAVTRKAAQLLDSLEQSSRDRLMQPDLFSTPQIVEASPPEASLRDVLAGINPDEITPKQAQAWLYELKRMCED